MINALANYLHFTSLDEAVEKGGLFPIPCTFTIRDPKSGRLVNISSECNGVTPTSKAVEVGETVTQNPVSYTHLTLPTIYSV